MAVAWIFLLKNSAKGGRERHILVSPLGLEGGWGVGRRGVLHILLLLSYNTQNHQTVNYSPHLK